MSRTPLQDVLNPAGFDLGGVTLCPVKLFPDSSRLLAPVNLAPDWRLTLVRFFVRLAKACNQIECCGDFWMVGLVDPDWLIDRVGFALDGDPQKPVGKAALNLGFVNHRLKNCRGDMADQGAVNAG
jgi:hypothetical protein